MPTANTSTPERFSELATRLSAISIALSEALPDVSDPTIAKTILSASEYASRLAHFLEKTSTRLRRVQNYA